MIGIVLISHADICTALLHGAEMICGEQEKQIETVCLLSDSRLEEFDLQLQRAISKVDTGDGVVILADITGGTPFNRAARFVGENIQLIGGANLALLLELLSSREDKQIDIGEAVQVGLVNLRQFFPVTQSDEDIM